ncbi:MAG: hypothetical protein ACOCUI_02115, partial [bacterium]
KSLSDYLSSHIKKKIFVYSLFIAFITKFFLLNIFKFYDYYVQFDNLTVNFFILFLPITFYLIVGSLFYIFKNIKFFLPYFIFILVCMFYADLYNVDYSKNLKTEYPYFDIDKTNIFVSIYDNSYHGNADVFLSDFTPNPFFLLDKDVKIRKIIDKNDNEIEFIRNGNFVKIESENKYFKVFFYNRASFFPKIPSKVVNGKIKLKGFWHPVFNINKEINYNIKDHRKTKSIKIFNAEKYEGNIVVKNKHSYLISDNKISKLNKIGNIYFYYNETLNEDLIVKFIKDFYLYCQKKGNTSESINDNKQILMLFSDNDYNILALEIDFNYENILNFYSNKEAEYTEYFFWNMIENFFDELTIIFKVKKIQTRGLKFENAYTERIFYNKMSEIERKIEERENYLDTGKVITMSEIEKLLSSQK